jgi:hypothetical protein
MRLSDLLGSQVVTRTEQQIGRIHEVRAVQDGPLQGAFGAALRIEGLIVGRGSAATRLGLDRRDVKRLAAIQAILQRLHGRRLYVEWSDIIAIEQGRVIVAVPVEGFRRPAEMSWSEQVDVAGPG